MRVATWNVNSLRARLERVVDWIAYAQPDVLCLQETKLADSAFPALDIAALGYEAVHHGEGRWNGVAILSRIGLAEVVAGFADDLELDPEARLLTARCDGTVVITVYVPNGRAVGHDHYHYKLGWLDRLRAHVAAVGPADRDVVVLGDFNVAPADADVWDPAAVHGGTHVSAPERARVDDLLAGGFVDVVREHYPGTDRLYSWWDYRAGNFHKHKGMRIDLVLASVDLAARAEYALIDRFARKGTSPSDHAPVLVDFAAPSR